jgi:hypothetical protein
MYVSLNLKVQAVKYHKEHRAAFYITLIYVLKMQRFGFDPMHMHPPT